MRADADRDRIERLLEALGRHGQSGDRLYLAGGTSAVQVGWREFTQDVDLRIEAADSDALLRAIAELKDKLDVNVELAGPLDFLPAPDGWQDRSVYVGRYGAIDVYHTDFALQALAKLQRRLAWDISDVQAMLDRKLTTVDAIKQAFAAIEPDLYRFPVLDATRLKAAVDELTGP